MSGFEFTPAQWPYGYRPSDPEWMAAWAGVLRNASGASVIGDLVSYSTVDGTGVLDSGITAASVVSSVALTPVVTAVLPVILGAVATIAALRAATTTTLPRSQSYVLGYAANADGGDGPFVYVSTDTTSSDNGGTIIVDASGRRWYRLTSGQPFSVKWFGATGNGTTDDTAAIQACITASGAKTSGVFFPAGVYVISSALVFNQSGRYSGAGDQSSIIQTNSATADIVQITALYTTVSDLGFRSSVIKTAGSAINATASYVDIDRVFITAFFTGITIGGSASNTTVRVRNSWLINVAPNGSQIGILVINGVDLILANVWIVGTSGANLNSGVLVQNCGDLTLDHVSTVYAGNGLLVAPMASQNVQVIFVNNCYFDSGTGYGIYVAPTVTGVQVDVIKVTQTWCATNAAGGVGLNGAAGSTIQQFDAVNCIFANSTAGSGVVLGYTGIGRAAFVACAMSANTTGFTAASGVLNFKLIGCVIGASGEFTANTGTGVQLTGANDGFSITGNTVVGNGTQINYGGSPGTAGVTYFIAGNQGIVTNNYGVLVTTAGPTTFTITHGLFYTPLLQDITLTLQSGLGSATYFYLTGVTSTTFQINFNAAPGAGVNIGWRARTTGA